MFVKPLINGPTGTLRGPNDEIIPVAKALRVTFEPEEQTRKLLRNLLLCALVTLLISPSAVGATPTQIAWLGISFPQSFDASVFVFGLALALYALYGESWGEDMHQYKEAIKKRDEYVESGFKEDLRKLVNSFSRTQLEPLTSADVFESKLSELEREIKDRLRASTPTLGGGQRNVDGERQALESAPNLDSLHSIFVEIETVSKRHDASDFLVRFANIFMPRAALLFMFVSVLLDYFGFTWVDPPRLFS